MNIWQVKKLVCKELAHKAVEKTQEVPLHPGAIKLILKRYVDREIKDSENGLLISELILKAGDKFVVSFRGNDNLLNLTLLEPGTKKLTARAKESVKNLWNKFKLTEENSSLEYMNSAAVQKLMTAVSDKVTHRPHSIMTYNTNEDNNTLYYADFLSYYEQMASLAAEMVRTNLMFVGLRSEMKELPKPGDPDDILNLHQSPEQMPRYKIGNEARSFKTLLACMDLDFDTKKDANELVLLACTNKRIL